MASPILADVSAHRLAHFRRLRVKATGPPTSGHHHPSDTEMFALDIVLLDVATAACR